MWWVNNALTSFVLLAVISNSAFSRANAQSDTSLAGGALAGERLRIIVSSDIGGSDPDDHQSLVHVLMYADLFDVEGLVSSPPQAGRVAHILEVIDVYEKDYSRLSRRNAEYPTPDALRRVAKQGAVDPAPEAGYSDATEGSAWIITRALAKDERPLYVLVWGSITDVAQAVHDAPEIKAKLRVYSIGSWNTAQDRHARQYLFDHHTDMWWIESDSSFRGMYVGGNQEGDRGNRAFLSAHVAGHGALGDFLVGKLSAIKMGDTPSFLYLLAGNPDDPTSDHWGGRFVGNGHGPHYWTDDPEPTLAEGRYPGAKTVNRWREQFLSDWQKRMDRLVDEDSANH